MVRTRSDGHAADDEQGDAAAVALATAALLSAVNASDLAGVLAIWSEDGVLMPPHRASVHGRRAIEQYFGELFQRRKVQFFFPASRIELSGDMAVERVEYTVLMWSLTNESETVSDAGKGVHVYRRQADGSWKLSMDIWNSDSPSR
jgi:uncharacterized protein (TIGR02246 family)